MTVKARNRLIAFSIMAAPFVFLICLILFWTAEPLPPIAPLPNPNGYADLVKAGQMVTNDTSDDESVDIGDLQRKVDNNSNALQLARSSLTQPCRVPLEFTQDFMSKHLNDLSSLKQLALALQSEGILAGRQNRFEDSARDYLDIFQLGNDVGRGGVLMDQLVGTALEAIAVSHLQKIADQLNRTACRDTTVALQHLDAQRSSWQQVVQQEDAWSRRAFPGIRNEVARIMTRRTLQASLQNARDKFNAQAEKTRQLTIALAARTYELEKGHHPASVADLVPEYLEAIPTDPVTGKEMDLK